MTTGGALSTRCPAWCHQDHYGDPPNVDDHAAEPTWVPVTLLQRIMGGEQRRLDVTAAELLVVLVQPSDTAEPWISIGETEGTTVQIELSVGSARRLLRAITEQLAGA